MRVKIYLLLAVLCAAAAGYSFTRGDYILTASDLVVAVLIADGARKEWNQSRRTAQ